MSEENNRITDRRKMRVRRLKKLIMLTLVISIAVPWACCAVLFMKVNTLQDALRDTTSYVDEMNRLLQEQNGLLEQFLEESGTQGVGESAVSEAMKEETLLKDITANEAKPDTVGILTREPKRKVYLTFDDGPSIYTDDILDILDQYDIKATFFVLGKEDDSAKEALQQIVERGHSVGMHSYSHVYRDIYESLENFEEDFIKIQNYVYDVTGVKSTIYRFPGGSSNKVSDVDMQEFAEYLQTQGVTYYDWNIASGDGSRRLLSVQELVKNCTKDLENWQSAIVLLHDSGDKRTTVEALPIIIENILAMEDTVILPITEDTEPVQHINKINTNTKE